LTRGERFVLVGDNAFHGISHLSQERARARGKGILDPSNAAQLVQISLKNGAEGFMFSVSPTTLAILRELRGNDPTSPLSCYPIVPYAYEYVSRSTRAGGVSGMARSFLSETLYSGNLSAISKSISGVLTTNPADLLEAYLRYEISRVRSAAGRKGVIRSVLLHEVVIDMALALDLRWLFESHLRFSEKFGMRAGFETRNFAYLVKKLKQWGMPFDKVTIAAPFNGTGFLMTPSKEACEQSLREAEGATVIAMSIMAAGYIKLPEAVSYVSGMPNLGGAVAGVSNEAQAVETFRSLKERFSLSAATGNGTAQH
jgi:hypothetical protein